MNANIDVHSRGLIDGLPGDGVKYISKIQAHCENMSFNKITYDRIFQQVTHKGGGHE